MGRAAGVILTALVSVVVASPGRARACSMVGPAPHVIDAAQVGVDTMPPTLPKPIVEKIYRHDGTGCMSGDSCGDYTAADITNLATDDTTPAHKIGYRMAVVSGAPPAGLDLPSGAMDWPFDGSLQLLWPGNGDDVDFTLEMVAVDAAGNESVPQTVRIYDAVGGCSVRRHRDANDAGLAMVMLAVAMAARRRRAT